MANSFFEIIKHEPAISMFQNYICIVRCCLCPLYRKEQMVGAVRFELTTF